MSKFLSGLEPPQHWDRLCADSKALFASEAWQHVLQRGFGTESIYFSDESGGFVVSVFRGGPFRIGYLGFPTGATAGSLARRLDPAPILRSAGGIAMPVCVRVPVGTFDDNFVRSGTVVTNPETVIDDLQAWSLAGVSKNLRRDVRKAQRSDLSIESTSDVAHAAQLFRIYAGTVKRRGGAMRYNAGYFSALLELSATNPAVQVLLARESDVIAGFVVVVDDRGTANYLHGGAAPDFMKDSPSDLLLAAAIEQAQSRGCRRFNLMASPADQPTLVRYKEKWGGETRDLATCTIPLRPGYALFRVAERVLAWLR